ncbi:PTS sugar transporter subunit IIB [Lactobacillus sp. ESL0684]|uniref:PTS sugar transporter subunit IIB n=1 Tax=unclassified Lactobacillus TaxID=2620435 RepID=UPI0023F9BF41|nr:MULTISPECIES: PTS sugar transporter subunit IIB [unclassified Lactobacillus]WEV39990.1 PTS sugar transporter subunit IIB [Lactobacillus sp. ESL0681]WEV39998.1 PTS sugar transporter subunit IIB [Lactobacillus sp. ESL0681]WEV43469.1 PTS sugar transporter subunit IIB [Lactobacillus sp. ESL0684]
MVVSLIRVDDRIIHGLITTRWAKERPCDGIIAVNDKAATNQILKSAYKSAGEDQGKKTFVWTMDHFEKVQDKVLNSATRYFVITKNPLDMKHILVDLNFVPSDQKELIVGPGNDRDGAIKLGSNQSFTQEEGDAFEAISQKGYKVHFALLPDKQLGYWDKFKGKFGY